MLPPLPPTKTQSGAGNPSSASGAAPWTTRKFVHANCRRFCSINWHASASFSTAYTMPRAACNAISMDTEPVPAPISQAMLSRCKRSRESEIHRTSDLVIGVFPRMNRSSGKPNARVSLDKGAGFWMRRALRGSNVCPDNRSAGPVVMASSGYESRSPTDTVTPPSPARQSALHSSCAETFPARTKTFSWVRTSPARLQACPCALTRRMSSQGVCSLAQRYATVLMPQHSSIKCSGNKLRSFFAPL